MIYNVFSGGGFRKLRAFLSISLIMAITFAPALGFAKVNRVFKDAVLDAFVPLPLSDIPIPEPANLMGFVADRNAAIQLGKALFWDMSVGSHGDQACASCHFHAGADKRDKNQLNAGADGAFEVGGPNHPLTAGDYPFSTFMNPVDRFTARTRDRHDVTGSQGVPNTTFNGVVPGDPVENTTVTADGVFHAPAAGAAVNTRRVTGRNTPSMINAVHNLRNFWDGRAVPSFNGVTPFGQHDPNARIFVVGATGTVSPTAISLELSSLASQAVGPPMSDVEMSSIGRIWPDIGHKMLPMRPLQQQQVDPTDSILSGLIAPGTGLTGTYADMVRAAFLPIYWNSPTPVAVGGGLFTVMEANFSMFFGLSIQMYEATLVSDDAKFDQVRRGDPGAAFTANEKRGLEIFTNIGQNPNPDIPVPFCGICHLGSEFTGAAVSQVGLAPLVLPGVPEVPEFLVERMQTGATLGMATLSMSTAPLPDQLSFPATFDLNPATSPLTRLIVVTAQPGDPTARGRWEIAFGSKLSNPGVMTMAMEPAPERVLDPSATATLVVGNDGSISFEVATLNLPSGTYNVSAGGVVLGTVTAVPNQLYDLGFYNIGVTPTADDPGLGGNFPTPDGDPLGLAAQRLAGIDPAHILEGVPPVPNPITGGIMTLEPVLATDTRVLNNGAFKVPGLRNAELTAPYFHNGGKRTLCEVVEFYNRGGDFHEVNANDLDPTIQSLGMTNQDVADVVSFLLTLTDERVRHQSAPFDHPQLFVSNGHLGDDLSVFDTDGDGTADDNMVEIPAVGALGGAAITSFLGGSTGACLAPPPPPPADTGAPKVTAPANITVAALDGTGTPASNGAVQAFLLAFNATDNVGVTSVSDNAPAVFPLNTITLVTVTAFDAAGNTGSASASVTVADQAAPTVAAPADVTVDAVDATGMPVTDALIVAFLANFVPMDNVGVINVTNDAPATLPVGTTLVTVTATDAAGLTGSASANVTVVAPGAPADTIAPTVTAPANITVAALNGAGTPSSDGAIQAFLAGFGATDNVGVTNVSNNAPAVLPLNTITLVTVTASDAAGNMGSASASVTVADQTAPTVAAPADIIVDATTATGAPVTDPVIQAFLATFTSSDNVGVSNVSHNAPAELAIGTTLVTVTATDAAGLTGSASATVTVVDPGAVANTPLHDAVLAGNKGAVENLIAGGANADAIGVGGKTPLHLAAVANNKGMVELLLKNVTMINLTDNLGKTALSYATNGEVRKLLIKNGAI